MSDSAPRMLWSIIADAHAVVSTHVTAVERCERGKNFVIVRNESSGLHVRLDPVLWRLIQRLDGEHTISAVADNLSANDLLPDLNAEHERERVAHAIARLEQAGILSTGLPGAARQLWSRSEEHGKILQRKRWGNPLAVRIPLHDPSRMMAWLTPRIEPLLIRPAGIVCGLLMALACLTLFMSWQSIGSAFASLALSPRHWWSVLLVWPLLKLVHEIAHAVAIHRFSGRVYEWGVTFLVLMPVPYVDASDASLFSRRQRMIVGAAGMFAELTLAAIALLLWNMLEQGVLRELMFAVVVAGSINTVLFNANPLLRFDGYYILEDAAGLPNLASRASRWWLAWLKLRVFGVMEFPESLTRDRRELRWFSIYGALSVIYRYVVVAGITLWLLVAIPMIGLGLALFAIWPLCVKPVVSLVRWLCSSQVLEGQRSGAYRKLAFGVAVLVIVVGVLPLPSSTRVAGVVAVDGTASLMAPESGRLVLLNDQRVDPGDLLARIEAPALEDETQLLLAERERLSSARAAVAGTDALEARLLDKEMSILAQREATLAERVASLEIRAQSRGRFVPVDDGSSVGRLLQQGDPIGQVVDDRALRVRAIVRERQLERLRAGVDTVRVRLAESILKPVDAHLVREMPFADRKLPSAALAGEGIAGIAVAEVNDRLETLEPVFHVELGLPDELDVAGIGGRAYVTFAHPAESLADRWWRLTRQLFLERLAV